MQSIQQLFDRTFGATGETARKPNQALPESSRPARQQVVQQSYSVEFQLSELSVRQRGHHMFARELSMSASFRAQFGDEAPKLAEPKSQFYAAAPVFEPPSPQDVADTILGFVDRRLQSEAAAGASQEKLDDLLSQAREGVERGFAQAREQIEQLDMMNDELNDEIGQSFTLVNQGLDDLSEKYQLTAPTSAPVDAPVVAPAPEKPERKEAEKSVERGDRNDPPARGVNYQAGFEKFTGYSEEMSIDVRTNDGDIVKVYFSEAGASLQSGSLEAGTFGGRDRAGTYGSASSFSGVAYQSDYRIQVQGELDEGELQALSDLFAQADDLAERFFGGNFQDAFDAALKLEMDTSELASFSLSLTQTQVRQVSAYERIATPAQDAFNAPPGRGLPSQRAIEQLNSLTAQLREMVSVASVFPEPVKLASDFIDQSLRLREADQPAPTFDPGVRDQLPPFREFIDTLLPQLEQE